MPQLLAVLRKSFGLPSFRPLQRELIGELLAGRSAIGILPTGGGKSLCYQLPALLLPGATIVISPLISLMKDQVDGLTERGIPAVSLTSHDTGAEMNQKLTLLATGDIKLAFVAPERLGRPDLLAACRATSISLIAVDEAHCVSQWGHDFRPDYNNIPAFRTTVGSPPLLALTATAREKVRAEIAGLLGVPGARVFSLGTNRPNLWLGLEHCEDHSQRLAKVAQLARNSGGPTIIYVTSRRHSEEIATFLAHTLGEPVAPYHARLQAAERTDVQNRFMANRCRVVVATNAFGMGIDKPDIRAVIHAGLPGSIEAYFQEVGRAGRDGLPAKCIMALVPGADIRMRKFLVNKDTVVGVPDAVKKGRHERLNRMVDFVLSHDRCLRRQVMWYFDERLDKRPHPCCSICDPQTMPAMFVANGTAGPHRRPHRSRAAGQRQQAGAAAPSGQPPHPQAAIIFARLKSWRLDQARAIGKPAFFIVGENDLTGIAAAAPRNLDELARCRGVGPYKLERYGEQVVAEIAAALAEAAPPPPPIQDRNEAVALVGAAVLQGEDVPTVARNLNRTETEVFECLLLWVAADTTAAWKQVARRYLSADAYIAIRATVHRHPGDLQHCYQRLDRQYTKEQIRLTLTIMHKTGQEGGTPHAT